MTNEEAASDAMETYPTQTYGSPALDEADNKENVVLRSLVDDSGRYMPAAEHRSPSTMPTHQPPSPLMYTLGTRYQPIPPRHLPKKTDPKVYYIDSGRSEESPAIRQNSETPPMYRSENQSNEPVIFLQPQVISQPILYNIAGERPPPMTHERTPRSKEPPSPVLYSINGRPRTVDMSSNTFEDPTPISNKSPALYSLVGTSRLQNEVPEPTKHYLQPSPQFYSVIGSPARTSRGVQADTPSPVHPTPILYTIVGNTPTATSRPKEQRLSVSPRDTVMYTLDNESNVRKQQQERQQPQPTPTLYALVGKQLPLPVEETRTKPPARNRTPPPPALMVVTHRPSRSLERTPDVIIEEIVSYPTIKTHRPPPPKEPAALKPEPFIIPTNDEERRLRPPVSRQPPPSHAYTEQPVRKSNAVAQYPTVQSSDYHSPHTSRTRKPYREQKYTNTLPAITNHRPERKERPPLYEPRYRVERHHPYVTNKPTSLERYPVNTKPRPSLWDHGYQTQTDDDEDYEQRSYRKSRIHRAPRPRAPWIPVW